MGSWVNGIYLPVLDEVNWDDEVVGNFRRLGDLGINVKGYGALVDGTTNDTAAGNAAIDAAAAAGGGIVYIPAGTMCANLVLKPRVRLVGAGVGITILKSVAGSNADVVKGLDFATLTGKSLAALDYTRGAYEVGIENLTIDGNKANNSGGYGIRIWGRAPRMHNLEIRSCDDDGLWTEFTEVDDFLEPAQVLEGYYSNIAIHDCGGNGWTQRGPHDTVCINYTAWDNGGWALRNEASAGSYNGGGTFYNANSYLNANSFYASCGVNFFGGAASASNTGTGVQLETGAGTSKLIGMVVGGHTTGVLLKAQNCIIDVMFNGNLADCIEYGGTPGWNTIRFNSTNNGNGIKLAVNEVGPQHVVGVLNIGAGQTLKSGAGTLSTRSSYELTGSGAGGNDAFLHLPTDVLLSSNGWSPVLPQSNATLFAPTLQTGVPVSAAGIHAALVNLGLISA